MTHTTRRDFLASSVFAMLAARMPVQQRSTSAGPADAMLIDDLVTANRILANQGVVDGFGHVSARHNANPNRFLISRSLAPEQVTAADILELDLDGNPVDPKARASYQERFIHAEIYRARPDVKAVVHNHAPSIIAFADAGIPLRPTFHLAGFIGESAPIFDIRKSFGATDMLVSDSKKGRALAEVLGKGNVALMRGHGAVVVGPTIRHVVGRSIYLEVNARIESQAIGLNGNKVTYLDAQEAQKTIEAGENGGYERPWPLWKAKAMGK